MAKAFPTRLIHAGEGSARSLTTPIYETTTYTFENAAELRAYQAGGGGFLYSRYENPTVVALEAKLAEADGAEAALAFGSGMAAAATLLMTLTPPGDEVVCGAAVYGGTHHLLTGLLARFGVTARFVTPEQLTDLSPVLGPATRLVWFETPSNPTLRCVDIHRVAAACRKAGVVSVIDNTFASPVNQQPIALGVDLVMQSASKYLNGHSDVVAGVVAGGRDLMHRIGLTRRLLGGILDPQPAYALMRGLKTLEVRVARHNANGLAVARGLEGHAGIDRVWYPGLPSHPDHAVAKAQMAGFGGMICLDLAGGEEAAVRAYDRLRVVRRAASLGGVESIASLPVLTSHYGYTDAQLAEGGVTRGMLRVSVGLEDAGDVLEDLRQAVA